MNCQSEYLKRLCSPYLCEGEDAAEIDLCYSDKNWEYAQKSGKSLTMFEYNYTLYQFEKNIIGRGAFCYHSSALSVDGEGILFSADSGT